MINELVALARAKARAEARRVALRAAFALVGGVFILVAVGGLFVALFFWLAPGLGSIAAALICAGVAIVLAILALLPLAFKPRPVPQTAQEGALPQFISLMAKTAPNLAPRQLVLTAALLGVALALSARGSKK
jgi:hypothetical protein